MGTADQMQRFGFGPDFTGFSIEEGSLGFKRHSDRIPLSFMRARRHAGNHRSSSGIFLNSAELSKSRNVRHLRLRKPSLMR